MIENSRVRVPARVAGAFSSPESTFCADSYFGIVCLFSTPLYPLFLLLRCIDKHNLFLFLFFSFSFLLRLLLSLLLFPFFLFLLLLSPPPPYSSLLLLTPPPTPSPSSSLLLLLLLLPPPPYFFFFTSLRLLFSFLSSSPSVGVKNQYPSFFLPLLLLLLIPHPSLPLLSSFSSVVRLPDILKVLCT